LEGREGKGRGRKRRKGEGREGRRGGRGKEGKGKVASWLLGDGCPCPFLSDTHHHQIASVAISKLFTARCT